MRRRRRANMIPVMPTKAIATDAGSGTVLNSNSTVLSRSTYPALFLPSAVTTRFSAILNELLLGDQLVVACVNVCRPVLVKVLVSGFGIMVVGLGVPVKVAEAVTLLELVLQLLPGHEKLSWPATMSVALLARVVLE